MTNLFLQLSPCNSLASARPLHHRTPRIVYSWFYRCYQVFFALGVGGYVFILVEMFGFTAVFFGPQDPAAKTVYTLWGNSG